MIRSSTTATKGERLRFDFGPDGGSAVSVSGWTLQSNIARKPASDGTSTPLLVLTLGDGITVLDAAAGEIRVEISSVRMLALGVGRFFLDLWRIDSGNEDPIASVEILVSPTAKW